MKFDTREEWLAWRREGIGASDVAAILGISRWASPWSVWAEKVGVLPVADSDGDDLLRAGRYLEKSIAPWFADDTGLVVRSEQEVIVHPDFPWARCTLDAEIFESPTSETPVGNGEWKTAWPGPRWTEVPPDYVAQAYWQQFVGGYERTWVAVLMGRRLDIHEVPRDQDEIDFIVEQVTKFWHDHVLTGDPPPVDGSDATREAMVAVYGEPEPGSIVDASDRADEIAAILEARDQWKAEINRLGLLYEGESNRLRALIGDAEELHVNGERVASWKWQERRSLDTKAIEANHPRIAKKYRRVTPVRVLRTH